MDLPGDMLDTELVEQSIDSAANILFNELHLQCTVVV